MFIPLYKPFDLTNTLHSGQAFRWRWDGLWHQGVVFDNIVMIRQADGGLYVRCETEEYNVLWPVLEDYLGLRVDLASIYSALSEDHRLKTAISRYRGMRILRQDPWECLISFICSAASNIRRITRNIESLCEVYGTPLGSAPTTRNAFPTPYELSSAGERRIRELGLGYRAKYISETAKLIADGFVDLPSLRNKSYEYTLEKLTALPGIGDKVANCIMLFSLDKPEAFPVDVWIDRVLREWYLNSESSQINKSALRIWSQKRFGTYAGYANHYLFHDRRLLDRENRSS